MDKYFLYDTENGFETFETLDARKTEEKKAIAAYLEDGWSEDVEYVMSGIIAHRATKCDVQNKPPESELDEEGYDGDGQDWTGDYEYICNYEMKEIAEAKH